MSRHTIPHRHDAEIEVVVGWDGPTHSYFANVIDPRLPEEEEVVLTVPTRPWAEKIDTPYQLACAIRRHARLPKDVAVALEGDRETAPARTALQSDVEAMFKNLFGGE